MSPSKGGGSGGLALIALGIGALFLFGRQAAEAMGVEPMVPAGDTLIPASSFPVSTLPPLAPLPALPEAGTITAPGTTAVLQPGATTPLVPSAPVSATGGALVPTSRAVPAGTGSQAQASPFMLSDKAMAKLGLAAVKQVTKWFLTPSDVPATPLSPDVASAWQSYRFMEFSDYTEWAGAQSPLMDAPDLDVVGNTEALASVENVTGGIDAVSGVEGATGGLEAAGGAFPGEVGGLESATGTGVEATSMASETISLIGPALQVLGVCAVLIDIGFTIAGDQPAALKAVNVALDAAIIVCMFIPVWGWIVALILSIVKMIVGLFAGGGGASHAQREAEETVWYVEHGAKPFVRGLAAVRSPRELVDYMVAWTSGYCGGRNEVAIAFTLIDPEDYTAQVAIGSIHPGTNLPNECYANDLGTYTTHKFYRGMNPYTMTRDQMALALVEHGATDLKVIIQAGISEELKAPMNATMDDIITKKLVAWNEAMVGHGLDLDDMDAIAQEQRKQPRLMAIAAYFGFDDWKGLVQWHLQDYWTRYIVTNREGSLFGFAHACGYDSWTALRDDLMESYGAWYDALVSMENTIIEGEYVAKGTPITYVPVVPSHDWASYRG